MTHARDQVLEAYADGVDGVRRSAETITDWSLPTPCSGWNARDLAGHLLAIVRYYHRLLDAALLAHPLVDLPRGRGLARMNAADLAALPPEDGPRRTSRFLAEARHYRLRLVEVDWDIRIGSWEDLGPLTVAQHTGLAVIEWHVHAWDLATASGHEHRPSAPEIVAGAARTLPESMPTGDPWTATLRWAGRGPNSWTAMDS